MGGIQLNLTGEALSTGLLTTIVGMVIVFAILVLLTFCMYGLKLFAGKGPEAEAASKPAPPPPVETEPVSPPVPEVKQDDGAIIAVIAAAIAAYTGNRVSDIKVSSIRRVASVETGWAAQARRDLIDASRVL